MSQAKQTKNCTTDVHPETSGYPEGSPESDFVHAIMTAHEELERAQRERERS